MISARTVLGAVALAVACGEPEDAVPASSSVAHAVVEPAPSTAEGPAAPPAAPSPPLAPPGLAAGAPRSGPARPFVGSTLTQEQLLDLLATAIPRRFKPVGNTSVVFQVRLVGPADAAFKPASRQHPTGYLAEIAAYRLARVLGMDQVPPAVSRRFQDWQIQERLHEDYADAWPEILDWTLWEADRSVKGAAIYWIPEMRGIALERDGRMARWTRHLSQGGVIDDDERAYHSDISQMVGFDFLIGNWDRFSGSNTSTTPDRSRLYIRDHNAAFLQPLRPDLAERTQGHLLRVQKFSRRWVERLRRASRRALEAELREDPGFAAAPALSAAQIDDVMERRETLLSYIGSLVESFGPERVYAFD